MTVNVSCNQITAIIARIVGDLNTLTEPHHQHIYHLHTQPTSYHTIFFRTAK
jgi:hypothetical protein